MTPDLVSLLNNPDCPNYVIHDILLEKGISVATIYVVTGETGEYSDYRTWNVAGYLDKAAANELCSRLNGWCKDNGVHISVGRYCEQQGWNAFDNPNRAQEYDRRGNLKCPFDKYLDANTPYDAVLYSVCELPLQG